MNSKQIRQWWRSWPVRVGLIFGTLYLLTASRCVTVESLPLTEAMAGWQPRSPAFAPLTGWVALPLGLLPEAWQPVALNWFGAFCAALTLGLLAAILELAPWDRPLTTLPAWSRNFPLLLGAGLCGLQYDFWLAATQANGQSMQVVLFALAVWCLFRSRADGSRRWTECAAFVWGGGLVENWLLLLALPLFALTLAWMEVRRYRDAVRLLEHILNGRLIRAWSRQFLAGVAGYLTALLLALLLVQGSRPSPGWGGALHTLLAAEKRILQEASLQLTGGQVAITVLTLSFYLLPLAIFAFYRPEPELRNLGPMGRWKTGLRRAASAIYVLAVLWLAADPEFSPRLIWRKQTGEMMPLLSLDFVAGLSGAFLAGNLLLAWATEAARGRGRRLGFLRPRMVFQYGGAALVLISVTGLLVIAGRNLAVLREVNRHPFPAYGRAVLADLPSDRGIILADEPWRAASVRSAIAERGQSFRWAVVDVSRLADPTLRQWWAARQPGEWQTNVLAADWDTARQLAWFRSLSRTGPVFYLNESFGCFFEAYRLLPCGIAFRVMPRGSSGPATPWADGPETGHEAAVWQALSEGLPDFQTVGNISWLALPAPPLVQNEVLSRLYAVGWDDCGVRYQRQGDWPQAGRCFARAAQLQPDNLAVRLNQAANSNHLAGHPLTAAWAGGFAGQLESPGRLARLLLWSGPVDDPSLLFLTASTKARLGMYQQAAEEFQRVIELAPGEIPPQLAGAELLVQLGQAGPARKLLKTLRRDITSGPEATNVVLRTKLALLEAGSALLTTNPAAASQVLQQLADQFPDHPEVIPQLIDGFVACQDYPRAVAQSDRLLAQYPQAVQLQMAHASLLARTGAEAQALIVINQLLKQTNAPAVRLLRGQTEYQLHQWADAERDFRSVTNEPRYLATGQQWLKYVFSRPNTTNQSGPAPPPALRH
jgi:tetratricopeptide (TPR) repeat protein